MTGWKRWNPAPSTFYFCEAVVRFSISALFCLLILPTIAWADLKPSEVAILASATNPQSQAIAKYYAKQRGIPAGQICLVNLPEGEDLAQDAWQQQVRPTIRKWITDAPFGQNIRCLVTVWGVPLRIGKAAPSTNNEHRQFIDGELNRRLEVLETIASEAERQAGLSPQALLSDPTGDLGKTGGTGEEAKPVDPEQAKLDQLLKRLQPAFRKVQQNVQAIENAEERNRKAQGLQQVITRTSGSSAILESLGKAIQAQGQKPRPKMISEFQFLRGRMTGIGEARQLIEVQQLPSQMRDETSMYLIERMGGLIQTIRWLNEKQEIANKNETQASLDSELSLVLWPSYDLLRWQNNVLHARYESTRSRTANRTLMVSRIDAPTLVLAKGLIDTAMQVEAKGLDGTVYLDTRGVATRGAPTAAVQPGSFEAYDRTLFALETYIKANNKLPVVVNDKPELFQPGECKDAALYCGWYSLAKYVDAFDWKPGAIAYHMASSEAVTLKKPESQVWCKRLLEDGVCATIGPVAEPYLTAFPPPNEFFPLLMEGDLTLVECYYRTKPFNSWMMTLIGDPLYRPFKMSAK